MPSLAEYSDVQHLFEAEERRAALHVSELAQDIHRRVAQLDETVEPRFERLSPERAQEFVDAAAVALRLTSKPWRNIAYERASKSVLDELQIAGINPYRTRGGRERTQQQAVQRYLASARTIVSRFVRTLSSLEPLTPIEVVRVASGDTDPPHPHRELSWHLVMDGHGGYVSCGRCLDRCERSRAAGAHVLNIDPDDVRPEMRCHWCDVRVDGKPPVEIE